MICGFQAYLANDYDGTNTDGMERLSEWDGARTKRMGCRTIKYLV